VSSVSAVSAVMAVVVLAVSLAALARSCRFYPTCSETVHLHLRVRWPNASCTR
jgi:putative component of membrane protein insertase Oxa1/YidC/SpoIIIJ protein YidD